MSKKSNIFLIFFSFLFLLTGCTTLPDGTPSERTVEIHETAENNEPVTFNEALNMMSTELAVNVFSKFKGELKILFRNNAEGNYATSRLYRELKMFLPVVSVLNGEDFVIESSFRKIGSQKKIWYLRLKERSGRILWSDRAVIKEEVKSE